MCHFCHAQLFEITHVANIKSTLVQHSCRNAEVVEAFCPVTASRSNARRSIHQPPVAALHAPAEMPTALSSVPRYAEIHLVSCSRRAHRRERRRHATLIALVALPGVHTSRDCVPWRYLEAGQLSARSLFVAGVQKPAQQRTFVSICVSDPAARARLDAEAQFH